MLDKDPTNWSLTTWLLTATLSILSGFLDFFERSHKDWKHANGFQLFIRLLSSFLAGSLSLAAMVSINVQVGLALFLSALTAYGSPRIIPLMERKLIKKIDKTGS